MVSRPISNVIDGQLAALQLSFSNSNKKPISSLLVLCLLFASSRKYGGIELCKLFMFKYFPIVILALTEEKMS